MIFFVSFNISMTNMFEILGYFSLSDSLPQVDGPRKAGAHHYQHC